MAFKIKTIESKEDKERRERRNKLILGLILVVIMLLSTAGYAFFSTDTEKTDEQASSKVTYNNLDFYRLGDFWQTNISGYEFYFHYLPNETRNTEIKKTVNDYAGKPLYLTGNGIAEQEIGMNLGNVVTRAQPACLPYTMINCTGEWPVKNCSNNVIAIQERNFTTIVEEDNCVFIFSNDTVRDADAFLFRILGIK